MRRGAVIGSWWGVLCSLVVAVHGGCQFPKQWSGHWFQSGVPHLLTVNSTSIETKGECVEGQGDKFIVEDRVDSCYRCVVIHEKHPNVLQYKETYCDSRESLDHMCGQITGDANLFSMFRAEPAGLPVPCPFKGAPFTFTYNRGSGECGSPVSRVDSCTDESKLLLRYQACPDVQGTESAVEELECLATWKDGSTRYLVGKLYHKMATSDEDRYRCFVYDQQHQHSHHQVYQVAQSGDATCNGLPSALEGSRTMKLTTIENQHSRCRYPTFITDHHHWHTLDHSQSFVILHKNTTLRITREEGGQEMRVVCHNEYHTSHHQVTVVAHATSGCNSGYVCMAFYRREGHVIELQQSTLFVQVPEEACSPANFNPATLPYITLITTSLHKKRCPYLGRYTVSGLSVDGRQVSAARRKRKCSDEQGVVDNADVDSKAECGSYDFESLVVGCSENSDTMEFYSSCDTETVSAYFCHGSWEDNGTSYLIASPVSRKSVGARRFCFIYTRSDGESSMGLLQQAVGNKRNGVGPVSAMLRLSSVTESCHRNINPGVTGAWAFNLTIIGQCAEASTSAVSMTAIAFPSLFFVMTLAVVVSNMR
ncbi:uncharacterized protein LOC110834305 [Zootermopsis nevadensis]|nr:uncharacterized protein LOC110834305 [Zootermopsis nevadensis]